MRLTAVSRAGELAPSLYRNHPLCGDKLRRGWFFVCFEEARVGECGWMGVESCVAG